ncbi:MAG: c-type cytochrome [Acidobacteria bacterium]|nr:c-type cytochrome [Candidatus Sulfomarinibacter sp. MAG AM2]
MSTESTKHDREVLNQNDLLDHSYDGIQEYDNPLPRWWLAIFWATIVFAPLYVLYFHFGGGMLATERYDEAMIAFFDKQAEQLLALGEISEGTLVDLMADQSMMNGGRKVYQSKCATCHGMFGEGGIGPNLTDEYWLHGGQLLDVYKTVREGVPSKGMLAWERQLRPAQLMAVSAYVGTLLGNQTPNPKAAQGDHFVRLPPAEENQETPDDLPTAEAAAEPAAS